MSLLTQSSLVLIPSGYKEDIVYSVIPNDATGDLSFTRASNGTRINSDGLVEDVPWNLVRYSNDITNAIWSKVSGNGGTAPIVTANYATSPSGLNDATRIQLARTTTTDSFSVIRQAVTILTNTNYRQSVWLKSLSGTPTIFIADNGNFGTQFLVTLTTDWVRYELPFSNSFNFCDFDFALFQGVAGSSLSADFLVYGAQLNIGSTAKPYFPTTDRLNVPRLTYQNGGGGCPSLLLEPQRTNVYLYSSDFSNASWLKSNCTQTPNFSTSVISGINATKIDFTTIGFLNQTTSFVGNTTASIYVIVKADTLTKFRLVEAFYFGNFVEYDLVNKTATGTGGFISDLGNGWFQCGLTKTYGVGQTAISYSINSISTIGSLLICGAQAETGTYATSYIPTVASSATRIVDTYQKAGIGNTSTAGTLYYELIATNISSANGVYLIQLFAGSIVGGAAFSDANSISIAANGNQIKGYNNGYTRLLFTITPTIGSTVKIAIRYNGTNVVAFVDGTKQTVYADTSVGVKNALRVNNGEAGSQATKELIFFPTDLTDAECIALTTL